LNRRLTEKEREGLEEGKGSIIGGFMKRERRKGFTGGRIH